MAISQQNAVKHCEDCSVTKHFLPVDLSDKTATVAGVLLSGAGASFIFLSRLIRNNTAFLSFCAYLAGVLHWRL